MNTQQISTVALKWAAAAREAVKTASWAAKARRGAEPLAEETAKWASAAESAARHTVLSGGRRRAEAALRAIETAMFAAATATRSLVADQEVHLQSKVYFSTLAAKRKEAAREIIGWVATSATPTAKDDWCHISSYLDLDDGVEDELRRELIEHSRRASTALASLDIAGMEVQEEWEVAEELLLEVAEAEEEWELAAAELEEAKEYLKVEEVVEFASFLEKEARNLYDGEWAGQWAQPIWHFHLSLSGSATTTREAIATVVAMAGCLGAAVAAHEGLHPAEVHVAGHIARRNSLRWLSAEARSRRQ